MKKLYPSTLVLICLVAINFGTKAQSLRVAGSLFIPQDSIEFTYGSPDYDSTDWIGIYHVEEAPGGPPSVVWNYIPSDTGILRLKAPAETGVYKAFLLCCDGYDTIAMSGEFKVVAPVLTSSLSSYIQGDSIVFSYVSPKFSETDWIGIYPTGTKPGDANPSIDWEYIPDSAGTMTFKSSLDPGVYDAYLLCCDGYDSLSATTFTIIDANVANVSPKVASFAAGSPVEILYNDPEYASGDWIGIYFEGDDPSLVSSIVWQEISSKTGSVTFPGTLAGGSYFAVLFCCGTSDTEYTRSDVFTVLAGAAGTYIKTNASVYPVGSKVSVNFRDADWTDTDWIGIYPKGITPGDEESTLWEYAASDSGTIQFSDPLEAGDWVAYLLCCDAYNIKAKYDFKVSDENPSVVASSFAYAPTDSLVFYFNSPAFSETDWIGIYNPGDVPGDIGSITWLYIPQSSGTIVFRYPDNHSLTPGEYWAGLFCCDGYDLYAQTSFVISEGLPNAINPVNYTEKLAVFPNPTEGIFTIKTSEGDKLQQIKVYNMSGMLLYHENVTGSDTEKTLNLTKLNKGVYFLEIQTSNFKASKKLIIQ
jgi:hypothetical protein